MNPLTRTGSALAAAAATLATAAALAGPAGASTGHPGASGGASHVVFVQTDNTGGNQVVAYQRAANGTLTLAHAYATGGRGGQLTGSVVDHLASQGSLTYDPVSRLLYAVNAGSDTLSVFTASGDTLNLEQVLSSGGTFPVSVAVHGDWVYVLNALNGGSVQGFAVGNGRLHPVPGSRKPLNLARVTGPSQFTHTPGQVAFSPSGSQLIVTTKAAGNKVDVFSVHADGTLSSPVVNREPGTVPFAVTFDPAGHLVIAEAGINALGTYDLNANGTISPVSLVATGQAATCWVAGHGRWLFVSNAGSADLSDFTVGNGGGLTLHGQTATDPGTVDAAVAPRGRYLYVQTGANGIVDEYSVTGMTVTEIGSVTVAGAAGGEGIAAA